MDGLKVGLVAVCVALAAVLILEVAVFAPENKTSGIPATSKPLILINGSLYLGEAIPVGAPPPTNYTFGNATFELWITDEFGPGGPALVGNVSERGTVYHIALRALASQQYWISPDRLCGVLWAAQSAYLLAAYD
jgi:hypothetical protein